MPSASFDGSGDRLDIASNALFAFGTGDFTVEFWINLTSINNNYNQIGPNVAVSNGFSFYYTGPGDYYSNGANSFILSNRLINLMTRAYTLSTGRWYHIAISRNGTNLRLFVDGIQLGATVTNSTNFAQGPLNLGGNLDSSAHTINGLLGPIRITKNQARYTTNFIPPENYITLPPTITDTSKTNNGAVQITSNTEYLEIPADKNRFEFGTDDFTIECWIKINDFNGNNARIYSTGGNNPDISISIDPSGFISFWDGITNRTLAGPGTITTGRWYHIALSRYNGLAMLFIDGVKNYSQTINTYINSINNIQFPGTEIYKSADCLIDSLRVTKAARYTFDFKPLFRSLPIPDSNSYLDPYFANVSLLLNMQKNGSDPRLIDSSNNNFTVISYGNAALTNDNTFGTVANFDGTGDYLKIPDNTDFHFGSDDLTIECWVNKPSNAGVEILFTQRNNGADYAPIFFWINNGVLTCTLSSTGTSWMSGADLGFNTGVQVPTNAWTHLAVTRHNDTFYLFQNGDLLATYTSSAALYDSTRSASIGAYAEGSSFFTGKLGPLRITKGVARYTSNFTPPTKKAFYTPNKITGDPYYSYRSLILNMQGTAGMAVFTDESPNNFAITPYGNAQLAADATFGTVASFDGSGDYLNATSGLFQFGKNFTVEVWINRTSNTGEGLYRGQTIVDMRSPDTANAGFDIVLDRFDNQTYPKATVTTNGTVFLGSTTRIVNGLWYHLAIVKSESTLTIFINGQIESSVTNTTLSITNNILRIGYGVNGTFNGLIGPLRISPWAVYKSNFTPSQDLFPAMQDSTYANPYYDKVALQLKFDGTNGSTSFVDSGPNALAVTAVGNAQITSASKYGSGAGAFDGNGDYLTIADNAAFSFGTGPFTIELWYKPNVPLLNAGLVDLRSASSSSAGLLLRQGDNASDGLSLTCWAGLAGGTTPATKTGLILNNWNHIAVVRDPSNYLTVYVNGIGGTPVLRSINLTDQKFRFGAFVDATGSPNSANGLLDELEITKGVAKYKANFTPPVRGLSTIYNPYTTLPVSGAALWLDGADSSTLFTDAGVTPVNKSGDLVYQWSDKSGNNRHATQATSANRPTWVPPASGRNGLGALAFNGTSQFLSLANDAIGTNDFTIEFWMKQAATTNSYWVILDSRISGNFLGYPVILYDNSSTNLSFYNNGWLLSGSVATATWTHIAFTRKSGTIRMFINGVLASSNTDSSSYFTFRQLGKAFDPFYFNGQIQNLLIYNGQALYTSNFTIGEG